MAMILMTIAHFAFGKGLIKRRNLTYHYAEMTDFVLRYPHQKYTNYF